MFRITPYIRATRSLLCHSRQPGHQIAVISGCCPQLSNYVQPQVREPCPPPKPPPPPPPRDDTYFWGAMALLFLTGGFVVYAKRTPEVRDWLTINVPWFDDLIAVAYQENMSYAEFTEQCAGDLKKAIVKYLKDDKPKQCSSDGTPVPIGPAPEEVPDTQDEDDDEDNEGDDDEPCEKIPPPILTKDICEIDNCLKDLGDAAIHNFMTARDACIYYNKLVEDTMVKFSFAGIKELREAMTERQALVKDSLEKANAASSRLDDLSRYFECGVQAPKEALQKSKDLMKEYKDRIKTMKMQYQWENDKSLVVDVQWQKVEATLDKYTEENRSMFRDLKYENQKPSLEGDPDLLLHHTLRYVEQLREELADAVAGMTERVNRGLDTLPQGEKQKKAREADIQALYKKKRAEVVAEYKKRFDDQRLANDKMLKESLMKQLERHNETLQTRLKKKEIEVTAKLNKMVAEKVAVEKKLMAKQLLEMAMKLKIVEDKLNARLKAERETRRSQELWTAGASLLAATKKGDPVVKVDRELKAIEKASGDGDKLVLTVLKAIPESVKKEGVVPESVLREKYHVMETTAMKVALVEQEGAPLPVYFLSWLQYIFLFMKISGIPQEEYNKPPKEIAKELDTFDLLQRARFWMDRGNIAAALRYVSSLQGASRAAAVSWHDAARSHLETRQAAEAVLAHAAALGLQYI